MRNRIAGLAIALSLVGLMSGCTQMPTEKQGISDMRAQIAFKADSERAKSASVFVDGLRAGLVADYLEGQAALRILPGMHLLRVVTGNETLLEEKFYVADGVNRSFNLR